MTGPLPSTSGQNMFEEPACGPHAVIQAWELGAWLTGQLGWKVQAGKVSGGKEMA